MDIMPLGHSSFRIKSKHIAIVTDPFSPASVGIPFAKVDADVITVSHGHDDHNYIKGVDGDPLIIAGPGEYEVKGVRIIGHATYHDATKGSERGNNTVYLFEVDGVTILHCGDLGHKFTDADLEIVGGAAIVMIPTGGYYTISESIAAEVVAQLEPQVIIPMHYQRTGAKSDIHTHLSPLSSFLKAMGKEQITPQAKLTITKDKLPEEPMIVVLE